MAEYTVLHDKLAKLFLEKLNIEIPSGDTDLVDTGLLDSLALVELLLQLEQEFGVEITMDDLEIDSFRSLNRITEFVVSQNGSKEIIDS